MEVAPVVLDISHHNDVSAGGFAAMREFGVRGIIHKATQGTTYTDPMFSRRAPAAAEAGMLWGAYHFGDSSNPADQAAHFLDVSKPGKSDLVALDLEPNGARTMTTAQAVIFLDAVAQKLGRPAALYAGFYTLDGHMTDEQARYLGQHRLWLAAYNKAPKTPKPWTSPWLWQFSGDGRNSNGIVVPGVSRGVDMNAFGGTIAELEATWAAAPSQPSSADLDSRTKIERLQAMLATAGFSPGAIDGVVGPRTVKAVQMWGGLRGRDVDGIVGPRTRPILERAISTATT
jgi:lysozyme